MSSASAGENERKVEEKRQILTRAARRKAGIAPPTPLFKDQAKLSELDKENSTANHSEGSHQEEAPLPAKTDKTLKSARTPSSSSDTSSSSDEEGVGNGGREERRRGRRRRRRVWVQCENFSCKKWRRLEPGAHIDLSRHWYCHMHPDPALNSCSVPEEKIKVSRRRGFTFNRLEAGQLVWAKMAGFCPWPAVVSPDPWHEDYTHICEEREGCIYHVEFLGRDHTHLWLVEHQVELFYGSRCKPLLGVLKMTKALTFALQEADALQELSQQERLAKCKYRKTSSPAAAPAASAHSKKTAKSHKKKKQKKQKDTDRQPLSAVKTEPRSTLKCHTTEKKSAINSQATVPSCGPQAPNAVQLPTAISTAGALLQSLGIPVSLGTTAGPVPPAGTSLQPPDPLSSGLAKLLSLLSDGTTSINHNQPPPPPHANSSTAPTGQPYRHCRTEQAVRSQRAPSTAGDYVTTASGVGRLHFGLAPPTHPVVIPTPRESCAAIGAKSGQKALGPVSGGTVEVAGGKRERVRKRNRVGVVGSGRKQPLLNSGKKGKGLQVSPTIADYFKPASTSGSPGTAVAPATEISGTVNTTTTASSRQTGSRDQCVPTSDSEFVQLESEMETELREIEEMLARFTDSDPPSSSTPCDQEPCSGYRREAVGEDGSIKAALSEMTEIEGLLQEMSSGQLPTH